MTRRKYVDTYIEYMHTGKNQVNMFPFPKELTRFVTSMFLELCLGSGAVSQPGAGFSLCTLASSHSPKIYMLG